MHREEKYTLAKTTKGKLLELKMQKD